MSTLPQADCGIGSHVAFQDSSAMSNGKKSSPHHRMVETKDQGKQNPESRPSFRRLKALLKKIRASREETKGKKIPSSTPSMNSIGYTIFPSIYTICDTVPDHLHNVTICDFAPHYVLIHSSNSRNFSKPTSTPNQPPESLYPLVTSTLANPPP